MSSNKDSIRLFKSLIADGCFYQNPSLEAVKYKDMPNKKWFMSPYHKDWYYHLPRKKISKPKSDILNATLDPCLKKLAICLNLSGYTTLPSCSGHYYSREKCNKIYNKILKDSEEIKSSGLNLIDVESGKTFYFQDSEWELPWNKKVFFDIASGTKSKPEGYIGFIVQKDSLDIINKFKKISEKMKGVNFNITKQSPSFKCELRVYTGNPITQCKTWNVIGDIISKHIKEKNIL